MANSDNGMPLPPEVQRNRQFATPNRMRKAGLFDAIQALQQPGDSEPNGSAGGENTLPSTSQSTASMQEIPRQFNGNGVQPTGPSDDQMFQGFLGAIKQANQMYGKAAGAYGGAQISAAFRGVHPLLYMRGYKGPDYGQPDPTVANMIATQAGQIVPQYEQLQNMLMRNKLLGAQIPNLQAETQRTQAQIPTIAPLAQSLIGQRGAEAGLANVRAQLAPQDLQLRQKIEQDLQDYRRMDIALMNRAQQVTERGQDIHLMTAIGGADSETAKTAMAQAAKAQQAHSKVKIAMNSLAQLQDLLTQSGAQGGIGTGLPGTGPIMGRVAGIPGVGPNIAGAVEGTDPVMVANIRQKIAQARIDYENAKGGVRLAASPQMFERMKEVTGLDLNQSAAGQLAGIRQQMSILSQAKAEIEAANPLGMAVINGQNISSLKNIVGNVPSVTGRQAVSIPSVRTAAGMTITSGAGGQDRLSQLKAEKARRQQLQYGNNQP